MSQKCEQFSYGTFGGILLGFLVAKREAKMSKGAFKDTLAEQCREMLSNVSRDVILFEHNFGQLSINIFRNIIEHTVQKKAME